MPHDVFICYSSKDKTVSDLVVTGLEMRGIRCWVAPRDLKPGMSWGSAIVDAIRSSQIVVLIFSAQANDSQQVIREIGDAVNNGLDVIPFRVEDVQPSGKLKYFLSMTHWIDGYSQPIEEHIDQLARSIGVHLGIEITSLDMDTTNGLIGEQQNDQGKKGGFFSHLFGKGENANLQIVDSIEIQSGSSTNVIEFCVGDVTQASHDQAVDVLVTSAYRNDYIPVPGSVFGSLFRKGISVEELASEKEVDLRGAFSCWLSKEINNPPEGVQFKRILCYEPGESAKAGEQIGDIFRSIAPFVGGSDPIRSVGTTLVAAGSSKRITETESLKLLVEAEVHWMSSGLPIEKFKIICLPNQKVKQLTGLFAELKSQYASLSKQRQSQFAYDCFISYSHQDMREIELFVDLLHEQKQDMRIFIDKHNLDPGSAWQREIYEAIDDCRKVATFFSPTYLNSKVCLEEFNIALCRHRESEQPVLKPIYLYSANLPTYMRLIQFIDCRESNREKLKQAAMIFLESLF